MYNLKLKLSTTSGDVDTQWEDRSDDCFDDNVAGINVRSTVYGERMSWAYRCTHSLFHSNSKRNDINEFLFDETDPFGIDNSEIYKHFKNMLIARKKSINGSYS